MWYYVAIINIETITAQTTLRVAACWRSPRTKESEVKKYKFGLEDKKDARVVIRQLK